MKDYLNDSFNAKLVTVNLNEYHLKKLRDFYTLVVNLRMYASTKTHYDRLDEWSKPIYDFIHTMLDISEFANGHPEKNTSSECIFWFTIYKLMSSIIYSPNLKTEVANHHSSAYERNEALIKELEYIMEDIK